VIPFALAAIGMCVIAPSTADAAPNLLNGCKSSTTPGAEMGHYPAWPGVQSYLRVACIFNHSTAGSGDFVSSTFTIHDFANVNYHNGAARSITFSGGGGIGTTSFTTADCRGLAAAVNRGITGTGIPTRAFVTSFTGGCAPGGTVNLNRPLTAQAAGTYLVENSSVRSVTDATLSAVSPHVTSLTANFTAADTGLSFTGTNVGNGVTMTFLSATTADLSVAPTAGASQVVTIGGTLDGSGTPTAGVSTTRTFNDGTFGGGGTTITSTTPRFFVSDIGLRVAGTGITQPCFITARTNTVATLSSACNDNSAGLKTVTIGEPTRTAPVNTDTVFNQGVQLPLNPTLVAGSAPCTADESAGFGIEGTWLNPGSFVGGAFATQPASTKAIGEILVTTSVITYGGYILEIPGGLGIDPLIGAYHFNVVFPNVPTGLALCPSTATSPGLGFSIGVNATTVSQAAIPTGVGRPGTAQLRSTRASTGATAFTVFITDDINGAGVNWTGSEFNRFCSLPAPPAVIDFTCGDG
jgi:hypothetical protein